MQQETQPQQLEVGEFSKDDLQFLAQATVTATKVFNPETTSHGVGFYAKSSMVLRKIEAMLDKMAKEENDD